MGYKVERLTAKDYDELLHLLNTVFHKEEGNTFDVFLPVMWERTDERMSKHLAIRENGKIVAVVGVYPLPTIIYGEEIMFSTIGNVATLPEFEGRGMMKALMSQALLEAKRMGIDVARLAGTRQRYNRYGFERAGIDYVFKLNRKNIIDYYGGKTVGNEMLYSGSQLSGGKGFSKKFDFVQINLNDTNLIDDVMNLEQNSPLFVERGDREQFFKTLSAYQNGIWGAVDENGKLVGYINASKDKMQVFENRSNNVENQYQMLVEWLLHIGEREITIHTAPWEYQLNQFLFKVSEKWSFCDTSMFNVFNWGKTLNFLLKIKSKYTYIPDGNFILKIEDYGTVEFAGAKCFDSNKEPQITLSHLDAIRLLLGSAPLITESNIFDFADERTRLYLQCVFPLPLWWCNQDRV